MQADFDIVVIGGGMVGLTMAACLKKTAYRVAVIEAASLSLASSQNYDDRTTALSNGSRNILQQLSFWQPLCKDATPIERIHVSNQGYFGLTRINAKEENVEALGYVIENNVLLKFLLAQLQEVDGSITFFSPAVVKSVVNRDDGVSLTLEYQGAKQAINSKLLIAADGAHSSVRNLLQLEAVVKDYSQTAIVANVSSQQPHRNQAFERFTKTGPLAFLPMAPSQQGDVRCSVVWTVMSSVADEILSLDDSAFIARLQEQFGYRLGALHKVGRRYGYALQMIRSKQTISSRTVFIGNASNALHPVAGQGFNLALRDIADLTKLLLAEGGDPGSATKLQQYQVDRQQDHKRVAFFTDGLVQSFSNTIPGLSHFRAFGLLLVDMLPAVRSQLAKQSMGLNTTLPIFNKGIDKHA